jgi:hypothetical protein
MDDQHFHRAAYKRPLDPDFVETLADGPITENEQPAGTQAGTVYVQETEGIYDYTTQR